MPGQCYGCGTEFGVFKKEHGCKNCGFAFCSKCLHDKSVPVPKRNNAKHHVCHKCFKILTGKVESDAEQVKYDLPEAYLKRVATLNERQSGSVSSGIASGATGHSPSVPPHLRSLEKPDREIAMRLEKLKEAKKPKEKVTDRDLNARLANLKGQQHIPEQKPVYRPPDRRTQVEQVDDLLDEIASEVEIDSHRPDPVREVEERLHKFKYGDGKATGGQIRNNLNDKGSKYGNNLNLAGKSDSFDSKSYDKNIGNITGASKGASNSDDVDMDEMHQLIAAAADEMEVDAQRALDGMQRDKELMSRLRDIQRRKEEKRDNASDSVASNEDNGAQASALGASNADSDEEDEEEAAKRIIQRYLAEAKIDEATGYTANNRVEEDNRSKDKRISKKVNNADRNEPKPSNIKPPTKKELVDSDYDDSDELPYCCICTEDAVLRCRDCDLDLYCNRCFRECHAEVGLTDHRTTPYKAPKGYR